LGTYRVPWQPRFYFFTLMGRGIAPPGLAYTVQLDDIGRFGLCDGRVVEGCAA